ncbi:hypothetical protein [Noviherbaspirillum sp. ST9]|uniref:hypothetical protein n=1 Tax=Noviherbaspirillum sp. ST9 TaxID=3401606 RepID=UPI003B586CF2
MDDYPEIRKTVIDLILKRKTKEQGHVHEARVSVKSLHKTFVQLCEQQGITREDYPLNTKSCGRRSLARFVHDVLHGNPEDGVEARFGKVARSRMNTGTGQASSPISLAPFDLVGMDPHKMHCYGTVRIPGPVGPQRVPIERLWIIPVLEGHTKAILGYSVGIRTECSAATAENAVISAMSQWQPRALKVPTMRYKPGAALPSGIFPELVGRAWVTMMVDNAAIHYSKTIAERARRRVGCFLNFGPLGHWEHRAALERLMKTLELYGFQRLPSSTGSSPQDPLRDDPVKRAVEIGIDWEVLLDLIDVTCANYNVEANGALGNRSPLSVLRDFMHADPPEFLLRRLPPANAQQPELGVKVEIRYVRGDPAKGRRPYVEIDRVHYTSTILANAMGLIGKKLRIHIRESNMCTVTAYHEGGEELGVLSAQGAWGRVPHTREMRKQINALRDAGELAIGPDDDPVHQLMQYYASKAHREAEKQPLKVSKPATKLVNAAAASGLPVPTAIQPSELAQTAKPSEQQPASLSRLVKPPVWKTIT